MNRVSQLCDAESARTDTLCARSTDQPIDGWSTGEALGGVGLCGDRHDRGD
jgi:hypothetical protein